MTDQRKMTWDEVVAEMVKAQARVKVLENALVEIISDELHDDIGPAFNHGYIKGIAQRALEGENNDISS